MSYSPVSQKLQYQLLSSAVDVTTNITRQPIKNHQITFKINRMKLETHLESIYVMLRVQMLLCMAKWVFPQKMPHRCISIRHRQSMLYILCSKLCLSVLITQHRLLTLFVVKFRNRFKTIFSQVTCGKGSTLGPQALLVFNLIVL